jgi:hypothetical protein
MLDTCHFSLLFIVTVMVMTFGCGAFSSSVPDTAQNRPPILNAYLGNNPHCRHIPWKHPDGGVEEGESFPSLVADLEALPADGVWSLSATVFDSNRRVLAQLKANVSAKQGRIHQVWRLEAPLEGPYTLQLRVKQGGRSYAETRDLRLYRLFGKVTDFQGHPVKATVMAIGIEGGSVTTDETGVYSLWLPTVHIEALHAHDAGYGTTSIETWIYDYTPKEDLNLDLHIGQIEIYELRAWRGFTGVKVDFLPMSVSCCLSALKREGARGRFAPEFLPEDIKAVLGETDTRILSVDKRNEMLTNSEDIGMGDYRKEYSLFISDPTCSPHAEYGSLQVLKLALQHRYKENGQDFTEQGEGFYLGLRNGMAIDAGMDY